jgi:hypothetical protein
MEKICTLVTEMALPDFVVTVSEMNRWRYLSISIIVFHRKSIRAHLPDLITHLYGRFVSYLVDVWFCELVFRYLFVEMGMLSSILFDCFLSLAFISLIYREWWILFR